MESWREQVESPPWFSSYTINGYGEVFYSLIKLYKPTKIVELGTKAGYSAYFMAKALRENGAGNIDCYDLWEDYEYTSCEESVAQKNLQEYSDIIQLKRQDVAGLHESYDSIDVLHVDLGNHGDMYDEILTPWIPKVTGLIILEGGSVKRDSVDWMKKYNKKPIQQWLQENKDKFEYIVLEPFPSLTILKPKHSSS